MTKITSTPLPVPLTKRVDLSALTALFRVTLAKHTRGRRLLTLSLLFAIPILLAVLARRYADHYDPDEGEKRLLFFMIPNALIPLTALLYASGLIQDELEEQTLTYLLIRPLPRWSIYMVKLLATQFFTMTLAGVFIFATYITIYWDDPALVKDILPDRAWKMAALIALALLAYNSLFGCLSLFVKKSLTVGIAYIIMFEGVLSNIDFVARKATVMYHFRVLCERWLGLDVSEWSIDLDTAPTSRESLAWLLGASLVATVIAAWWFSVREWRLKTPEGN